MLALLLAAWRLLLGALTLVALLVWALGSGVAGLVIVALWLLGGAPVVEEPPSYEVPARTLTEWDKELD